MKGYSQVPGTTFEPVANEPEEGTTMACETILEN